MSKQEMVDCFNELLSYVDKIVEEDSKEDPRQQEYFLQQPASSTIIRHEFVIEFIGHAVECLKDLLSFSYFANSSYPLQQLVQELVKAFIKWRSLMSISNRCDDEDANVSAFLRSIETEVRRAVIKVYNYLPEEMNEVREDQMYYMLEMIQRSIDHTGEYLGGVCALRASTLADEYTSIPNTTTEIAVAVLTSSIKALLKDLIGISELNFCWKGLMRDNIETFHENLDFLHIFFVDLPVQINLQDIREVTFAAGVVVSLMNGEVMMEDNYSKAGELNQALVDFEDKFEQFLSSLSIRQDQLKLRKTVQSFLTKNNNSIGSVDFHLDNLEEMYLKVLQPSIRDDRCTDLVALVSGKTHELEYIIDSLAIGEVPVSCLKLWLWEITKEIKQIKAETGENKIDDHLMTFEVSKSQMASKKPDDTHTTNKVMVGFEDAIKTVRKQLIEGSICCVSQVYTGKELLVALLTDVMELKKLAEDELADKLQRYLKTKRYLLVLDDVWETQVWDDLYSSFPDTGNGSRILLITQLNEVAECEGFIAHHLRQFRDDESWTLLKETVLQNDTSFFQELEIIANEIGKKCGGLPLLVVLVAGILAKTDKEVEDWKKVLRSGVSWVLMI
ncbi:putative late blight resistance protein homolog R1A-4 [Solanum dulcamara]|uniref:putative late blight resistance protein homolog R1A-4 n=1 Tax=Solanum dulcamara TaxID=45834 RepID=UPI002485F5A3|nr:putative late blight resistance protein homolog R1A-4 [Solanum dulcamara]